MNDQIRKIARDCGLSISQVYSTEFNKFAELIVQECAELLENQHTWVTNVAASKILRKHFGFEE